MAVQPIPLDRPFASDVIPQTTTFEIVAERDELVLLRYDGIRCWKKRAHFEGRAVLWLPLSAEASQPVDIETPTVVEPQGLQLSPFERYARRVALQAASEVTHG